MYHLRQQNIKLNITGIILGIQGIIWQRQRGQFFSISNSDLRNRYVYSIFTLLLMKQIFQKKSHQEQHPKTGRSFSLELLLDNKVEYINISRRKKQNSKG